MGKTSTYNYHRFRARFMRMVTHKKIYTDEEAHRKHVLQYWEQYGTKAAVDAFHISRSMLYVWRTRAEDGELSARSRKPLHTRMPTTDQQIIDRICAVRTAYPYMGKDKIAVVLQREGITISASTVGRVISRYRLPSAPRQWVKKRDSVKRTRKPLDYTVQKPGDLVGLDTVVMQLHGRKKYITTALDHHTRIAMARMYSSPNSRNATDLLTRMQAALGVPIQAVNTDNGSELLAHFEKACTHLNIQHFFTRPRTPQMNAHVERFNRTIQEESQLPSFFASISDWNKTLSRYLMSYNFFRPHTALGYKTPAEVFSNSHPHESSMWWTHTQSCVLWHLSLRFPGLKFLIMSTTYTLAAAPRDPTQKPRDVRASTPQRVTAELYGAGKDNQHLSLDYQEFRRVLRDAGESSVIDLTIEGGATEKVLVHDVQYHPITDEFLHVDFLHVDMNKPVTTHVPLSFVGESPAVKLGGLLMHLKDSVEIRCLPSDLPHDIEVDISSLENFGDSIQVSGLALDREKLEVFDADDVAVCNVQAPKTAEQIEADLAEPVGDAVSEADKKDQADQAAAAEAGKEDKKD